MKREDTSLEDDDMYNLSFQEINYLINFYYLNLKEFDQTSLCKKLNISRGHPMLQKFMVVLLHKNIISFKNCIGSCKFFAINNKKLREFILEQNKLKHWIEIMPSKFDIVK
jgi:hypothetical protein